MKQQSNNHKILVISPTLSGGSWLSTEKIVQHLDATNVVVLSQGKVYHPVPGYTYVTIPYPAYDRWGSITTKSTIINILWNLPVLILASIYLLIYRPHLMITNGLVLGFLLSPLAKALHMKTVVAYHSYVANIDFITKMIMRSLSTFVDLVIANSKGSADDIGKIVHTNKIIINEHYAEDTFFQVPVHRKNKQFTLLYVGRLDYDKLCYPLIQIAEQLQDTTIQFQFAGVGEYEKKIKALETKHDSIHYLGYVNDRKKLAKLYEKADVVWSCGDTTYLAMPAVEALASATPIMIPYLQALGEDNDVNARITTSVVPREVGWLIDPEDLPAIKKLIHDIVTTKKYQQMRTACRTYAEKKYTKKNLLQTVETIQKLLPSEHL